MDDVLADTSTAILNLYNDKFGTTYQKEHFKNNDLWDTTVGPKYVAHIRQDLFQPGFFRNLTVLPDAQKVMKALHEQYEIFIVSAAMEFPNSLKEKLEWMEEHFEFIGWKNIVLCGDKSVTTGDFLIDDHEKNLKTFAGKPLLFDAMHNQQTQGYDRMENWQQIGELLL